MLMIEERKKIVEFGKKLITEGLTTGTGGNISIVDREKGYFAISPSGIDYFETEIEDIVIMDLEGNVVEGKRKPSSEFEMHRLIYLNREESGAVVHCHSTFATVLACNRMDLPASNYIIADAGGKDIKCAEYATFGTREIGEKAVEAMVGRRACLQANHGQITFGKTLESAFNLAKTVEQLSKIHVFASACGKPVIIDDEEVENIVHRFQNYGQSTKEEQ
ncbi:L-fuculose-phosphate aldolase [Anaerosphaera multitolerans]|uniref:L-fuculose-phosphate aldolase n=1 Tax=Anaerosphaera multitolerans TaxID=2487351 RepID=A0A437S5E1_9FIRM|nr:L-fuculose-phosphate aldolase [Anaerosphaera multitolerans]RVU54214.1 L-fuculose-phosphate aldolase [Anaerosphaera multitolerans]